MDKAHWVYDPVHDKWDCKICGQAYQFTFEGPKENNYRYCPGCGNEIVLEEETS